MTIFYVVTSHVVVETMMNTGARPIADPTIIDLATHSDLLGLFFAC